jgi:hypothetical protein
MEYPNKTFVLDIIKETGFGTKRRHIVMVAAKDKETAAEYLKDKLGFDGVPNDLTWLMNTHHITLYDQTGRKELEVQAKILYNAASIL